MNISAIEERAGTKFQAMKYYRWQQKDELPVAMLAVAGACLFHYTAAVLENVGVGNHDDLIQNANSLSGGRHDYFPYNDRAARGVAYRSESGVFLVSLLIDPVDEGDDVDEVALLWLPVEGGAVLGLGPDRARLEALVGPLPELERRAHVDTVLGHG